MKLCVCALSTNPSLQFFKCYATIYYRDLKTIFQFCKFLLNKIFEFLINKKFVLIDNR